MDVLIAAQTQLLEDASNSLREDKHRRKAALAVELRSSTWSDAEHWVCRFCDWVVNEEGEKEDVVNQRGRMNCYKCSKPRPDQNKRPWYNTDSDDW